VAHNASIAPMRCRLGTLFPPPISYQLMYLVGV